MRILRLPEGVARKIGRDPALLKQVQDVYCSRLTTARACPAKCELCISRLETMADEFKGQEGIGLWRTIVQTHTATILERFHESKKSRGKPARLEPERGVAGALVEKLRS